MINVFFSNFYFFIFLKITAGLPDYDFYAVLKARKVETPGEMGRPVVIGEDRQSEMKDKFKINQFNLLATDLIAANRSLPDVRMEAYVVLFYCAFAYLFRHLVFCPLLEHSDH